MKNKEHQSFKYISPRLAFLDSETYQGRYADTNLAYEKGRMRRFGESLHLPNVRGTRQRKRRRDARRR